MMTNDIAAEQTCSIRLRYYVFQLYNNYCHEALLGISKTRMHDLSCVLFGSECWRVVKGDMAKIDAFHNGCLRKICGIFWPNKISNLELHRRRAATVLSWNLNAYD